MQKILSANLKSIPIRSKGNISSPFVKSANFKIADEFVSKQALQQKSKPMIFTSALLAMTLFIAQTTNKIKNKLQASKEITEEQANISAQKEAIDLYKKTTNHKVENEDFIKKHINSKNIEKFKMLTQGLKDYVVYDNNDFRTILENIDNIDDNNLEILINKKDSKNDYNLFYSDTIADIVKNLKPENNDSLTEIIDCVGNEGGKTLSQYLVKDIIKSVTPNNKKVLSELLNFKTDNGHFRIDTYSYSNYLNNLTNKQAKYIPEVYDYKYKTNDIRLCAVDGNIELCKCFADKKIKETALKIANSYKSEKYKIHRFDSLDGLKDFCVKFNNDNRNKTLKRLYNEKNSNGEYKYNNLKTLLELSNALDKKSTNVVIKKVMRLKDEQGRPKIREFEAEAIKNIKPNFNISLFSELLNMKTDRGLDLNSLVMCTNTFKNFKANEFPIPVQMPQIRNDNFANVMTNIFDLSKNPLLVKNFNFSQKNNMKTTLEEILNNPKNDFEKMPFNVQELKNTVDKSFSKVISISNVSKDNQIKLFNNVLANKPEVETIIRNANFEAYKKEGLPLLYSRKDFVKDLTTILDTLSEQEQKKILDKLEISLTENKQGYNGIINIFDNPINETEKQISKLAENFVLKNKVQTGNGELDNTLNSLISGMPEFVNVIGKQQHASHDFSVDIHILSVLKNVLKDENFKKLPVQKQFELKTAILMHDIAKTEGTVDKSHQINSALYSTNILSRYSIPRSTKDNIYELIKEHHWLEELNNHEDLQLIAAKIRTKENYEALKVMTKADLKSCSNSINNSYKHLLDDENQKFLKECINNIDKNGNLIFTSKIVNKNKIPQVNYDGKTYRVIDFKNIPDTEDLESVGFVKGTKKSDLAFFVHVNDKASNLSSAKELDNIINSSVLSESLITLQNSNMYWNIPYGVVLENENKNIATAYFANQASGYEKTYKNWALSMFGKNFRTFVPDIIKNSLDLVDDEYVELFRLLENKKHLSQIKDETIYKVNNKSLTGKQIKDAILQAQEELVKNKYNHNEIVAYNSKVVGLLAKVNSIEEIKPEMLNFAYEKDLPIYLLGQ
ncbi:MAG: hypothetical protein MJ229_00370 [bacterium]|nr:hypothetical protein [bacterium]